MVVSSPLSRRAQRPHARLPPRTRGGQIIRFRRPVAPAIVSSRSADWNNGLLPRPVASVVVFLFESAGITAGASFAAGTRRAAMPVQAVAGGIGGCAIPLNRREQRPALPLLPCREERRPLHLQRRVASAVALSLPSRLGQRTITPRPREHHKRRHLYLRRPVASAVVSLPPTRRKKSSPAGVGSRAVAITPHAVASGIGGSILPR